MRVFNVYVDNSRADDGYETIFSTLNESLAWKGRNLVQDTTGLNAFVEVGSHLVTGLGEVADILGEGNNIPGSVLEKVEIDRW